MHNALALHCVQYKSDPVIACIFYTSATVRALTPSRGHLP